VWVTEALLGGAPATDVLRELVAEGVPQRLAAREIDVIASAVGVFRQVQRKLDVRAKRRDQVLRLLGEVARSAGTEQAPWSRLPEVTDGAASPGVIERVPSLDAEAFFRHHYAASRPVVLTDTIRRWPQVATWSPAWFRAHFGAAEVAVTVDRTSDPDYDRNTPAHTRTMTLGAFVDRMDELGHSNDIYMVARNEALGTPALASLLAGLSDLPPFLRAHHLAGCVSLWLGPAGTKTPLHHDTSNILFCQIHGRKRVHLCAPWERALLADVRAVYSACDAEAAPGTPGAIPASVQVYEVELEAGEALFLPVGWWHQVRALTPSVSLSFTNFARPNRFDWYAPGAV
jgi:ribosomal protein L16 Arg81 hydroxylase